MSRLVVVERVEPQPGGERSLVFGEDQDGKKVAFGLPREQADVMQSLLDQGEVVAAELPDDESGPLEATSHVVLDVPASALPKRRRN